MCVCPSIETNNKVNSKVLVYTKFLHLHFPQTENDVTAQRTLPPFTW